MQATATITMLWLVLLATIVANGSAQTSCPVGQLLVDGTCYVCPEGMVCPGGTAVNLACSVTTALDTPRPGCDTQLPFTLTDNRALSYGTQGVTAASNYPGARGGFGYGVDIKNQIIWVFGGSRTIDANYGWLDQQLGDLWKLEMKTNMWTWMQGPTTIRAGPVYGTKGVAAASNSPGSRYVLNHFQVGSTGLLWLYGSLRYDGGATADMWCYNPATNMWTWVAGTVSTQPNYGTKYVYSATTTPGYRHHAAAAIVTIDGVDYFVLMNGWDYNANDIFVFNTVTLQWKHMYGYRDRPMPATYPSMYGPVGVYSTSYGPTMNNEATLLPDRYEPHLVVLVMGTASGYYGGGAGISFNDIWKFNVLTGEFAWFGGSKFNVSGPISSPSPAVYPTRPGINSDLLPSAAPIAIGGGRRTRATMDHNNNVWMFGDGQWLWMFSFVTNSFTWMSGNYATSSTLPPVGVMTTSLLPSPIRVEHGIIADGSGVIHIYGGGVNGGTANGQYWQLGNGMRCAAGTFKMNVWDTKQSQCITCPVDHYCPTGTANNTWIACPSGWHSQAGSSSLSDCTGGPTPLCDAGQIPLGASCIPCAAGTFAVQGATICTACTAGQYQNKTGQSQCIGCDRGQFSTGGSATCTPCQAGTSSNAMNTAQCTSCVAGSFSSAGARVCSPCPTGTYSSTGAGVCSTCNQATSSTFVTIGLPYCCAKGLSVMGEKFMKQFGTTLYANYRTVTDTIYASNDFTDAIAAQVEEQAAIGASLIRNQEFCFA